MKHYDVLQSTRTAASIRRPAPEPLFLDAPAIAGLLAVNRRTLRRMIIKGDFPSADLKLSTTLLRWKRETVENWIADHATGGATR